MLPVNLNDLTPAHIQSLIDSEVAESLTLEFKSELPTGQSEQKREFLYDIAAMANSAGGDFVFGINDRRGADDQSTNIAEKLSGMALPNLQTEVDRLSNLIRDCISPRLSGVMSAHLVCSDGQVVVIRVPRSWNKPHMVTIDAVNKFYRRMGAQKYLMSVDEIRRAFSEQGELGDAIRQWRSHRSELIARGEGPVPLLNGGVTMLFHAIPASAFTVDVLRESWKLSEKEKRQIRVPHGITNGRYNGDGFIATFKAADRVYGYTQMFRSGMIEYADGHCSGPTPVNSACQIFGLGIELQMVHCYDNAIAHYRIQGRAEPLYVGFSLIGIANKSIYATPGISVFDHHLIREDIFNSPEVFVDINEPEEMPYPKTLLPLIDTMWQVAGYEGTPFKVEGVWEPFKKRHI